MTDDSPMPFGKHKGVPMKNVPADYLDWLADQPWLQEWPALMAYIEHNRDAIDMELEVDEGNDG